MTEKKTDALHVLRDVLRFHQAMGIEMYPASNDVRRFLNRVDGPGAKRHELPGPAATATASPSAGLDSLEKEISACALCRLSHDSPGRVPGRGRSGCRLMIVGDWSSQSGIFSPDILFGKDEDAMLRKMITAIELQADQVYVTNSLKCCPADAGIIDSRCEESCFSFLAREIATVNPRVVCAMGEIPVRALMGRKEPLARLRGRFGSYRSQSGRSVPVMPTFHPRFLLQHQEMKKATWNDLLAIKRCLAEAL
ncbi:MAG: uracil-DNA glycosylase [Desulfobulbaceae bacterium]|nr:uracil-DNA glycosylase [Desulfobulbaceae bacterium]